MENLILRISLLIASLIALPKIFLKFIDLIKWLLSVTLVFFFPTRGGNALKIVSENLKIDSIDDSIKIEEEKMELVEPSK